VTHFAITRDASVNATSLNHRNFASPALKLIHTATPDKTGLPRLPVDRRRRERAGQVRPLTRSSVVRHENVNKLWIAACLNFFADNTVSSCLAGDVNLALVVLVCCFISQVQYGDAFYNVLARRAEHCNGRLFLYPLAYFRNTARKLH